MAQGNPSEPAIQASGHSQAAIAHRFATDPAGHRFEVNRDDYSGTRLLAADAVVARLLLREMRYRGIERVFGVPREQSGLVALIALGLFLRAAQARAQRALKGHAGPTVADAVLGIGTARELLYDVAGPEVRNLPLGGALITIAVCGRLLAPVVVRSVREVKTGLRDATMGFHSRYGHMVGRSGARRTRAAKAVGQP